MVRYQVLLSLDIYDMVAIAINKLCKLNFRYFTMHLAISQQQGYQGFLKYKYDVLLRFRDYSLLTF